MSGLAAATAVHYAIASLAPALLALTIGLMVHRPAAALNLLAPCRRSHLL